MGTLNYPAAPLMKIGHEQKLDIGSSKGPTDVLDGIYRAKQYVKDDDKEFYRSPRAMPFDQPWQWASSKGFKNEEIDKVFLGQLAGCNLDCDECYAACDAGTVDVTPEEYVDAFNRYCKEFGTCSVLRVSGGEPMLFQEWVWGIAEEYQRRVQDEPILWIDTNLTVEPRSYLLRKLTYHRHSAICGCFKPNRQYHDGSVVSIWDQVSVVRDIMESGTNLFLYWPSWDKEALDDNTLLNSVLNELHRIDEYLPLRLTVIRTNKYEASPNMDNISQDTLNLYYGRRQRALHDYLARHYHPSMISMPSHYTLGMN